LIDISKALQINGWMNESIELPWLAEQASKHKMIAEVGSYLGRSTRAMADNTSGVIYAVDTWKGTLADEKFPKEPHEGYFLDEFTKNLGDHLWNGTVKALRMTSLEAAAAFSGDGTRFGFIFIDGDHSYESVRNDILAWRPLLEKGGTISGHDFDIGGYPGVVQAVRELIAPVPNQVGGSSLWYLET
jgi:predicted O-methyltransferase YrrM